MFIMILKITLLILSSMFSGILLYRASVIAKITRQQSETEYKTFFIDFLIINGKSVLLHVLGLLPILMLTLLVVLEDYNDILFVGGAIVSAIGSFSFTRAISEQTYEKLQATPSNDITTIAQVRDRINRNSIIRSAIVTIGVLLMGLSLILTGI